MEEGCVNNLEKLPTSFIPYDLLSLVQLQMGIGSPKRHLFDRQFRVGVCQTFCKQWLKGPGKIFKF